MGIPLLPWVGHRRLCRCSRYHAIKATKCLQTRVFFPNIVAVFLKPQFATFVTIHCTVVQYVPHYTVKNAPQTYIASSTRLHSTHGICIFRTQTAVSTVYTYSSCARDFGDLYVYDSLSSSSSDRKPKQRTTEPQMNASPCKKDNISAIWYIISRCLFSHHPSNPSDVQSCSKCVQKS